jgi:sugar/nucleoside kinase (ribokinase family)
LVDKFDIVGVGSAIVDVISYRSDAFIEKHGLHKGATTLLSAKKLEKLYHAMGASTECSGGCAANTMVGMAMLGGKSAFIGKVQDDYGGKVFAKSLEKNNVTLHSQNHKAKGETTRCLIIISEEEDEHRDKVIIERTMALHLGASQEISPDDISEDMIKSAKILFLEGFLWDFENGRLAAEKALDIAKTHKIKVAFALSDKLCVERNRDTFLQLIHDQAHLLFCNEAEARALLEMKIGTQILYPFTELCKSNHVDLGALTVGESGSYLISGDEIHTIDATPVRDAFDMTGAGDMYAAGVLYGYSQKMNLNKSGKLGSRCASEVIKYLGARPLTDLKDQLEGL